MSHKIEVTVPDIGDFKDVEVIDVLVRPGDAVEREQALLTLETEKATMDVPSPAAGRVLELRVAKGDHVSRGTLVLVLEAEAGAAAAAPVAAAASAAAPPPAVAPVAAAPPAPARVAPRTEALAEHRPPIEEAGFSRAHASPSVRRFARELGVDLGRVRGSGAKGRITQDDVKAFVKQTLTAGPAASGGTSLPRVPEVDFAAFGPVEVKPLGRIQRISGARLHASWVNLPHVTQFDEADITDLEQVRAQLKQKAQDLGIKLTPLAFMIRAVARALAQFPQFNASLDAEGQNLVWKRYCHIGFAADTPKGLVVPVIRDADRKDVYELARELGALSAKARDGKLPAAEMQGGC
ncbi:MAG: 2-oxo acid dehydrogenase subunit E2, partial [Steroidobacteraceae bacterium]|nr:2-oxo acid dehydrogenase subunit E2 [Steroidobacteraceae bacterium]